MRTKYLLIALVIALMIALVACDNGDTPTQATAEMTAITTTEGDATATTTDSTTTAATTTTATTKSGIIELPPVDVR